MKLLITIITCTTLISFLATLGKQVSAITCIWHQYNFQCQKRVSKRVDGFIFRPNKKLQHCMNQKGQVSLSMLFFVFLGFVFVWLGLAELLGVRKVILQREQLMACTSWLETKSRQYNQNMDYLNDLIKKTRIAELSLTIKPAASIALKAQRLILETKQQILTFKFPLMSNRPFSGCQIAPVTGSILFQHTKLVLQRDSQWKTVKILPFGNINLSLENFFMNLKIKRIGRSYQFLRFLTEKATP